MPRWFFLAVGLSLCLGCDSITTGKQADGHTADHDHEHAAHDELVMDEPPPPTVSIDHDAEEHSHAGELIEIGHGEYHAELTHDEHEVVVQLLDRAAQQSASIREEAIFVNLVVDDQPLQFRLAATREEGNADVGASVFRSEDPQLIATLAEGKFRGAIAMQVEGRGYRGDIDSH